MSEDNGHHGEKAIERIRSLTVPPGWTRVSVGEVGDVRLGRQRSPKNRSAEFPTKYIRAANITWNGLDLSDVLDMEFRPNEHESYRLRRGDILLSEASGSPGEVGKPAIWNEELDGCCFQNTVIRFRPKAVRAKFALIVFQHFARNKVFSRVSKGVGIHHLSADRFSSMPFLLPPEREQDRVVGKVEELFSGLDAGVAALKRAKANLKRYRASVLKAAVEGKLTASPTDAPAVPLGELIGPLGQGWSPKCELNRKPDADEWGIIKTTAIQPMKYGDDEAKPLPSRLIPRPDLEIKVGDMLMTRKGIALQFSRQFPEIVPIYEAACEAGSLVVGTVQTIRLSRLTGMDGPSFIINFPTKKHWRGDSQIEYVETGLQSLREEISRHGIKSIAVPPLGCGLGGLDWSDVRKLIVDALGDLQDVRVVVYEPAGAPAAKAMKAAPAKPKMTSGRAALLGLMQRYLAPLMDDAITLLELHKLMYFMQEAGEPLRLDFVKGRYGPYSTNLRHVLNAIEGHFLTGFGDASEEPGKTLEALPGALEKAEGYLQEKSRAETLSRFQRVEELMEGFETAYGLELLGSVHWVAKYEPSPAKTVDEATALVHAWNDRKRTSFPRAHIDVAWNRLRNLRWLS